MKSLFITLRPWQNFLTKCDSLDCWRPAFVLYVSANLWARATFRLKVVLIISLQYALLPTTGAIDVHCSLLWINCYRWFIGIYSVKRCKFDSKDFTHTYVRVRRESHPVTSPLLSHQSYRVQSIIFYLLSAVCYCTCLLSPSTLLRSNLISSYGH